MFFCFLKKNERKKKTGGKGDEKDRKKERQIDRNERRHRCTPARGDRQTGIYQVTERLRETKTKTEKETE